MNMHTSLNSLTRTRRRNYRCVPPDTGHSMSVRVSISVTIRISSTMSIKYSYEYKYYY